VAFELSGERASLQENSQDRSKGEDAALWDVAVLMIDRLAPQLHIGLVRRDCSHGEYPVSKTPDHLIRHERVPTWPFMIEIDESFDWGIVTDNALCEVWIVE